MAYKFEGFIRGAQAYDESTCVALIDSAYQYLIDPSSVPLAKISIPFRPLFSSIYDIINKASQYTMKQLEDSLDRIAKPVARALL